METNFNFKTQVCTDKNQSERLLALGLKPETADMCLSKVNVFCQTVDFMSPHSWTKEQLVSDTWYPAWSLHRLIEIMPQSIHIKEEDFCLRYFMGTIDYVDDDFRNLKFFDNGNVYDNIVGCIEWLIKKGYFNKEYLV